VARRVLVWEGAAGARVELTLLGGAAMRRLNRRHTGRRGLTDVIAFALPQPDGSVLGDVYICPAAAARWVRGGGGGGGGGDDGGGSPGAPGKRGAPVEQELVRLTVHGTLHVLGYDHPDGRGRTRSAMWRRQERYVRRLTNGKD
jgi:probable rRNA maturation factor